MLKCPKCGNSEHFAIDVRAIADYNQMKNCFTNVRKIKFPPFNDDGYACVCKKCFHKAPFNEFDTRYQ